MCLGFCYAPVQPASPLTFKSSWRQCDLSNTCASTLRVQRRPRMCSYVVIQDDEADDRELYELAVSTDGQLKSRPLGPDPAFLEPCTACNNTGFVPCKNCNAEGFIRDPRAVNVFYCPDCVGHKKLRCPTCGGRCYMCE